MVTIAGVLVLLPGLLFGLAFIVDLFRFLNGAPPAPYGNQRAQDFVEGRNLLVLIYDLPPLLLLPSALALFLRWRWARPLTTVAVIATLTVPASRIFAAAYLGVLGTRPLITLAVWLAWAVFILLSIWRRSVAAEFSGTSQSA